MLIAKILIAVWLALLPAEQIVRLDFMVTEFCEQQSCHKAQVVAVEQGDSVYFFITCLEWRAEKRRLRWFINAKSATQTQWIVVVAKSP